MKGSRAEYQREYQKNWQKKFKEEHGVSYRDALALKKAVVAVTGKETTVEEVMAQYTDGHWAVESNYDIKCSACGKKWDVRFNDCQAFNYCPNCGKRMG
jgi:hypothetical protein